MMKLNIDCMRAVMIAIEDQPLGSETSLSKLIDLLPQFDEDEIHYACIKLYEADMINALTITSFGFSGEQIASVQDLTYEGHQLLENIRNDTVYQKTKTFIKNKGINASINIISNVAQHIITDLLGI